MLMFFIFLLDHVKLGDIGVICTGYAYVLYFSPCLVKIKCKMKRESEKEEPHSGMLKHWCTVYKCT